MMINKNFPNYSKEKIPVKVVSHFSGANRASRRRDLAEARHEPALARKRRIQESLEIGRIAHRKAVEKRQEATHQRALKRKPPLTR